MNEKAGWLRGGTIWVLEPVEAADRSVRSLNPYLERMNVKGIKAMEQACVHLGDIAEEAEVLLRGLRKQIEDARKQIGEEE